MSCKIPGPTNQSCITFPIDPGTLCLGTSAAARSLGTAPLTVDFSFAESARRDFFRSTIREALRRGARPTNTDFLVIKYLFWIDQQGLDPCNPPGSVGR